MMYDAAVIGCGVTGAAVAYTLSKDRLSVAVREAENDVSDGTTKANSGILHAGYDPEPGTLMAKLNVRGTALAKELCAKLDVPVKWNGSLVISFSEEDDAEVKKLYDRGIKNGVPGLQLLTAEQVRNMEPSLSPSVRSALLAPSAGVVSPWEYAFAMIETAVKNGVELRRSFRVMSIKKLPEGGYELTSRSGQKVQAKYVVNAAGIYTDLVHNMASAPSFTITPVKGEYYLMDKSEGNVVNHVIFQCPSKSGKGVLVSPTAHGNLIVGPNAVSCGREDTSVTSEGLAFVGELAKKSVPSLNLRNSIRNFAGVRAVSDKDDFIIQEAPDAKGFIDLAGIKSPGLSSAAAIGEYCAELLEKSGLPFEEKKTFTDTRRRIKFAGLSAEEKAVLVKTDPHYGRIICRCETVTEGEILDALSSPVPPVSIDGVKRRCGAGMGRCQGGFCSPRVMEILMKEAGISYRNLIQDKEGSFILEGRTKMQDTAESLQNAGTEQVSVCSTAAGAK